MEAKRSNTQTLHKSQTSKTQVLKTASEVSLTPSQAAEQAKLNARKNPLDALSRMSLRHQAVEKRSGLQDVDDEYFKKNMFSRASLVKHSGLTEPYSTRSQMQNVNATSGAPVQQAPMMQTESAYRMQGGAEGVPQTPSQAKLQAQQHPNIQAQSQNQLPGQGQGQGMGMGTGQTPNQMAGQPQAQQPGQPTMPMHSHSHQHQHQQQQQMPPPNAQMQCKNQSFKESHATAAAQQAAMMGQQQPLMSNEPDMCTTCPNCHTTIYLVRNDASNEPPAAGYPTQNEGHATPIN